MNPASPTNPMSFATPHGVGPIPPSLHWALVLLLTIITGVFHYIWMFIQAAFVKKIDPQSRATLFYALGLLASLTGAAIAIVFAVVMQGLMNGDSSGFGGGALVAMVLALCLGSGLTIAGFFSMRSSLLHYYNSVEPIGLRLSGMMTFFFNILYFQYHFTRISKWKETGILAPQ